MNVNIFDEVMHRLSSKTRIRSLFRDVHVEDLEKIIDRLQKVLEEKKQLDAEKDAEVRAKQNNIDVIRKLMEEKGISIEDFGQLSGKEKKKRNIKRYLFEYQDVRGVTHQWEGSLTGRAPKVFQEYLQRTGKERSNCIIADR